MKVMLERVRKGKGKVERKGLREKGCGRETKKEEKGKMNKKHKKRKENEKKRKEK